MRSESLALPQDDGFDELDDYDETEIPPPEHCVYCIRYHSCHIHVDQPKHDDNRGQAQAQDATFYGPGSSNNVGMYGDQHGQHHEHHPYDQDEGYDAEAVMTPAPVDAAPTDGAANGTGNGNGSLGYQANPNFPYTIVYYGHAYGQSYAQGHQYPPPQANVDQEMSDSDGGAPLNSYNGAAPSNPVASGAMAPSHYFYHANAMDDEDDMEREDDDLDGDEDLDDEDLDDEELALIEEDLYLPPDQTPAASNAPIPSLMQYLQGTGPQPIASVSALAQALVNQATNQLPAQGLTDDELSLDEEEQALLLDPFPPVHISNPNPSILGSENYGLIDFLRVWAYGHIIIRGKKLAAPGLHRVLKQATSGVERVHYHDLRGDGCDMQGLDWDSMNTTRHAARRIRRLTYKNYVNRTGSDIHSSGEAQLPSTDSFFRFRRMDIRKDISLAHFQLRSVLACPTRTHAYYPSTQGINVMNNSTKRTSLAMNLRAFAGMTAPAVSTLDAGCGVLMAGTFNGDYFLQSLGTQDKKAYSEGQISNDISGITNHIKIYKPRRSGSPVAAIASNDQGFRLLDLQTEKFTAKFTYPFALNCSAMSPDGRLRVVVGDDLNVLITNAETGEILQQLGGHRDYGFACDWSDNGYTVATGFQDRTVKIWDARYWRNANGVSAPLTTITTEMAGVRNLRFSPSGSGRPVLAAAEEADFINLIDAQTFSTKQTIDVFGEIGGVAFTNDGQDLNVLCCDAHRGGLLQFERCSFGVDEPLSGGRQRTHGERGPFNQWDFVKRRRPPMYMDGPGVF
ncbi:hypothetical protein V8C26DRAFT_17000 [Trichoderma gracile]